MTKYVYTFGNGQAEGGAEMKNLLGGKGANLAEMNRIGVPVPPGFTITTEVCTIFNEKGRNAAFEIIKEDVKKAVSLVEELTGTKFGSKENPCLVSVRSGARASMPGMMDTILNLGINDFAVEGIANKSGNPRFAWDSYRRFVQMYGTCLTCSIEFDVSGGKNRFSPACKFILWRNISDRTVQTLIVVMPYKISHKAIRIIQRQGSMDANAGALDRFVIAFEFAVTLRIIRRGLYMRHTTDANKLFEVLRDKLRAVVRDNPRSSIGEFLTGTLENHFDLRFRHGRANIPMDDISAKTVQNGTHVVKCAADVDVRNVNMPVFMWF